MPEFMSPNIYHGLSGRLFADFDNERIQDRNIVGLSQSDEMINFDGRHVILKHHDYVYLYMQTDEFPDEYVVAEGFIIANPYTFKPYRWCCKLTSEIEYFEDYNQRFKK